MLEKCRLHVVQCTDVDGIKYVINFDYPNSSEDYVHRIGRTGRRNTTGTSYAFFTPNNSRQAKDLVSVLQEANQEVNPKLTELARQGGGGYGKRSKYYIFLEHVIIKL
jgi:superfamily II DNA/RNA helicase